MSEWCRRVALFNFAAFLSVYFSVYPTEWQKLSRAKQTNKQTNKQTGGVCEQFSRIVSS